MNTRSPRVRSSIGFLIVWAPVLTTLVSVFTIGCSQQGETTPLTSNSQSPVAPEAVTPQSQVPGLVALPVIPVAPAGYSISVVLNDKQLTFLTPADLAKLPQIKATVDGTEEQGPTLMTALNSLGIKDFTQITIDGMSKGRIATAELILTKAQVTDNVMLALVTRGTVKLTGTDIGGAKAIVDVNKLVIK